MGNTDNNGSDYLLSQGYSKEDIEQAEEKLATLTVEDLLAQDTYISKLEAGMPEAPASLNFYGISQEGWNIQFTLRDVDENILMQRFERFTDYLSAMRIEPKAVGQQNIATVAQAAPVSAEPTYVPSGVDLDTPGIVVFPVESITHQVSTNGVHYLNAKGGKWTQYGWKAWPEVVPTTVNVEQLPFGELKEVPGELAMAWADTTKKKIVAFGKVV
jgi:hypothetical protein